MQGKPLSKLRTWQGACISLLAVCRLESRKHLSASLGECGKHIYRNTALLCITTCFYLKRHLLEVDQAANERLTQLMPPMIKAAGITEQLKAAGQMKWVGLINAVKAQVEEIIFSELIYAGISNKIKDIMYGKCYDNL